MADNEVVFPAAPSGRVVEVMRALHAPPGGDAYWPLLEARVLARIAQAADNRWWQVLDAWARRGLVAAAVILAVAGALLVRSHNAQIQIAYDAAAQSVAADSPILPSGALTERSGPSERDATFQDVISH